MQDVRHQISRRSNAGIHPRKEDSAQGLVRGCRRYEEPIAWYQKKPVAFGGHVTGLLFTEVRPSATSWLVLIKARGSVGSSAEAVVWSANAKRSEPVSSPDHPFPFRKYEHSAPASYPYLLPRWGLKHSLLPSTPIG